MAFERLQGGTRHRVPEPHHLVVRRRRRRRRRRLTVPRGDYSVDAARMAFECRQHRTCRRVPGPYCLVIRYRCHHLTVLRERYSVGLARMA
jgi:hypothetical protein